MKLITALRSEMLKTKRTASFYFTLIGAVPIPAIFLLNVLTDSDDLEATRVDTLNAMLELGTTRTGLVFFPIFVILICTLLPQIEYRNNTWKQVFASPQTKSNVFLAKFLNINLLILLFLLATIVYMFVAIVITHFAYPSMDLLSQPFDVPRLLIRTGNTYATILAMCALQFWLGLRFRNFLVPTAVGLALWIAGVMMSFEFKPDFVYYFPYSFQNFTFIKELQPKMPQIVWTSVGYAAVFLSLGFLEFRRRRLTS